MPANMSKSTDIATQVAVNTQQERWKPIETARAIKATIDSGKTIEEVMTLFGIKSKQSIETKLKLLEAPASLQEAVENGLAYSAAAEILRIKDPTVQEEITKRAVDEQMSIGDVRAAIETAADIAEATTGEKIKQRRKRKTRDGEIKERRKNMRQPEEIIKHLGSIKTELENCEDITTRNKFEGWVAALSWVMTPKAEFVANETPKKVSEEMDDLLKELNEDDDSPADLPDGDDE
jgi:ParB-like chromosome segregation protein Spo0J